MKNDDLHQPIRQTIALVLTGDHVYKMDHARLIADHVEHGAPCTVACFVVPLAEASAFGVMSADAQRFYRSPGGEVLLTSSMLVSLGATQT